ncbi:MAG: hypothetical protein PHR68_02030 [Candidatus Gracilibacteria bacterium]|nr:hypothetical protein [Candidatus Gracilibacteria bacterium]
MNNLKQYFLGGLVFSGTVIVSFIGFAAYTSLPTQVDGVTITKDIWNNVINTINTIGTKVDTLSNVPTGAIMAFNLSTCPDGWIAANGSNGTPDLRGEFIRGLDSGRGVDTGRSLASWQKPSLTIGDVLSHNMLISFLGKNSISNRSEYGWEDPTLNSYTSTYANGGYSFGLATTNVYGSIDIATLGTIRPRNVAFLYCIKN